MKKKEIVLMKVMCNETIWMEYHVLTEDKRVGTGINELYRSLPGDFVSDFLVDDMLMLDLDPVVGPQDAYRIEDAGDQTYVKNPGYRDFKRWRHPHPLEP